MNIGADRWLDSWLAVPWNTAAFCVCVCAGCVPILCVSVRGKVCEHPSVCALTVVNSWQRKKKKSVVSKIFPSPSSLTQLSNHLRICASPTFSLILFWKEVLENMIQSEHRRRRQTNRAWCQEVKVLEQTCSLKEDFSNKLVFFDR